MSGTESKNSLKDLDILGSSLAGLTPEKKLSGYVSINEE